MKTATVKNVPIITRKVWLHSSHGYPPLDDWIILVCWNLLFPFLRILQDYSSQFQFQFQVKFLPKWGKSTDNDQNVSSWKGSQDTSTWQIVSHSSRAFWKKLPETPNLTCFTKSKWCRKGKSTWSKFNKFWRWSGYISMPRFRTFLPSVLQKMSRSCKFDLFH